MNAIVKVEDGELSAPIAGALTDKQALFVRAMVRNGGNQTEAAREAGYGDPGARAWELMRLPHVLAALRAETERQVLAGSAKGVGWMVRALDDPKLPGAVRFQCARWLAEAGGHGLAAQRAALGLPGDEKPLSDMSLAELDAFIAAGKAAAAQLATDRARTIEGSVVPSDARSEDDAAP